MTSTRRLAPTLFVSLFLVGHPGLANQQASQQASQRPPIWEEYRIGPEDVLSIVVWRNQDLTRQIQVRPDGKISLPLLNDVAVEGLTPMELRQRLTEALAAYIEAPEVSVLVDQIHSFKVSVLGKVRTPGRYELRSATTVLDGLAMAGGFMESDFSSPNEIVVLREHQGVTRRITIKYATAISPAGQQVNIFLQPDDIVVVP